MSQRNSIRHHCLFATLAFAALVALGSASSAEAGVFSFSPALTNGASAGIDNTVTYTVKTNMFNNDNLVTGNAIVNSVTFDGVDTAQNNGDISGVSLPNSTLNGLSSWNPVTAGVDAEIQALLTTGYAGPNLAPMVITNLTPGLTYEARLYFRAWTPGDAHRIPRWTVTNGTEIDPINVSIDKPMDNNIMHGTSYANNNAAWYLAYTYTAQGTSISITQGADTQGNLQAQGFTLTGSPYTNAHLYGLSNELLELNAVPEPGTYALGLIGLAGLSLAAAARRRGAGRKTGLYG